MRAVNLIPRTEQRPRLEGARTVLLVLAGGLAATTAALGVLTFTASGTADDRRGELAAVEAAIERLPDAPTPAVSQAALARERANRVAALSAALRTRVAFDRLMRDVSLVLPKDAWLIGISAVAPGGAAEDDADDAAEAGESPGEVTIQGATYSQAEVAHVLARLSVVPSLRDVRLGSSAVVDPPAGAKTRSGRARTVVTFTIVASVSARGTA